MIDAKQARETWDYNPETGEFLWRIKAGSRAIAGNRAGSINNKQYRYIKFGRINYRCCRLAWLIVTGEWPTAEIDHRNCDTADDRFENLREATRRGNTRNQRLRKDNTTGAKGVFPFGSKFMAKIGRRHLGTFSDIETAKAAYDRAALAEFGEFARL